MEDIRRKCNPIVDLSKFTSDKMMLSKVVVLGLQPIFCPTYNSCKNIGENFYPNFNFGPI